MTNNVKSPRTSCRAAATLALACLLGVLSSSVAAQVTPPPDFLVTARSTHSFNETLGLLKQAIEGQNLMVVHEVNPQQMLRMVGMRVDGMRQILFFHPRYMQRIIEANPNGGIVPPMKLIVMERPDGGVTVRYHDPVDAFAPYEGLGEVAAELRQLVETIVASVAG